MTEPAELRWFPLLKNIFSDFQTFGLTVFKTFSVANFQMFRLFDFQSQISQTVRHPKGSDFTLSVQVGVHPGLRDYDQSVVPNPENLKVSFNFLAMDNATR